MRAFTVVAGAIVVGSIVACGGGPSSIADDTYQGVPESLKGSAPSGPPVPVWKERGESFSITSWGSSCCVSVPTKIESSGSEVSIRFEDSGQQDCTADMAPTTHEFTLPDGAGKPPLKITLTYSSSEEMETVTLS